ncbi:MAG: sigma-70 family RNA polymerase sigma factor [Candidatus Omnitrophica bacterium]|nr:sigma-70 family RNA polymerase sigma factor [Candidatus Omnitrophota bacterium]
MDDLEFVKRCVSSDKLAWDEFIDRYSRLIYNYIYSVLRVKGINLSPQDNVNDIFQGILLSLVKDNFKKLRSFKGKNGCTLASWLRQVTINFTIDYLRSLRPAVSIDEENEEGSSLKDILADDELSVGEKFTHEERLRHLKDCIGKLEKEERYFLELYLNIGLGLEKIKEIFSVSRGAVDMRKSRIVDKLRDCFRRKGFALDS